MNGTVRSTAFSSAHLWWACATWRIKSPASTTQTAVFRFSVHCAVSPSDCTTTSQTCFLGYPDLSLPLKYLKVTRLQTTHPAASKTSPHMKDRFYVAKAKAYSLPLPKAFCFQTLLIVTVNSSKIYSQSPHSLNVTAVISQVRMKYHRSLSTAYRTKFHWQLIKPNKQRFVSQFLTYPTSKCLFFRPPKQRSTSIAVTLWFTDQHDSCVSPKIRLLSPIFVLSWTICKLAAFEFRRTGLLRHRFAGPFTCRFFSCTLRILKSDLPRSIFRCLCIKRFSIKQMSKYCLLTLLLRSAQLDLAKRHGSCNSSEIYFPFNPIQFQVRADFYWFNH